MLSKAPPDKELKRQNSRELPYLDRFIFAEQCKLTVNDN